MVMATPAPTSGWKEGNHQRPTDGLLLTQSTSNAVTTAHGQTNRSKKRRNHRAEKKKKARRQSFAVPVDENGSGSGSAMRSSQTILDQACSTAAGSSFYRLGQSNGTNMSETSLDSDTLLDHR